MLPSRSTDRHTHLRSCAAIALCAVAIAAPLAAQSPSASDTTRRARLIDTVAVIGRADDLAGIASSASEGHVGAADLRLRPITREGELLETVPGLIVTQHSGDGKANQYFVRGFNLDHGTDFNTSLEGMPLNLPTHGHGQGYTDLNFLIPELVDHIDYALGPYHARVGDFGSAGAAELTLRESLDEPFASLTTGAHGLARLAAGASHRLGGGTLLVGGETKRYDGPWQVPEQLRKTSAMARYTWTSGASQTSLLALAYHNRWDATDQIPLRAVREGLISPFGQLDSTDGGATQRYSLSASWRRLGTSSTQRGHLFAAYSDLALFSNFTYFLTDAVNGDQFSQTDHRMIYGGDLSHAQTMNALGAEHLMTIGAATRADVITGLGLYHTRRRERLATVREDDVRELGSGLFAQAESRWGSRVRSVVGLRGDAYSFAVNADRAENSGRRSAAIVSPKASLIVAPTKSTELYLSAGYGFHSNDARGTTIRVDPSTGEPASRVDPLVRSRGAEVGMRATPVAGMRTTATLWLLNLDSELLFTGDAGVTEPSAASARRGATIANFYRVSDALAIDADLSFARARFTGVAPEEDRIPGALERVFAGGVAYGSRTNGLFGSLRVRHFGSYPLAEDGALRARASTLLNGEVGYELRAGTRLQLTVLNVLNGTADDIQYAYSSRLHGETADGVDDVHFHPAEPRQLRIGVSHQFR
ncbi:MAG TPA: TonB-dependent receptor [Gemmatimonadaceae bacterium]|nr:TonB-dependent receptor [Gemmatimonadaceae bacterium]